MNTARKTISMFFVLLNVVLLGAGCATAPYRYGKASELATPLMLRDGEPQIEIGEPYMTLDALGNIVSIPTKLILWNIHVDCHNVGSNTIASLKQYLADNDLSQVKVRVNQYSPGGEWSRLFRNKAVGAGWRYTAGVLAGVYYTLVPGRIFGGDNYNPYTDTISLYSDHKAIALHEAGHAKDFANCTYKGTYAAIGSLPLVALYQEGRATGDALGYLRTKREIQDEKDAYKILYPAYSTYIAGEIGNFVSGTAGYFVTVGAVIPAHIVGRRKAAAVEKQPAGDPAQAAGAANAPSARAGD